MPRADVNLCHTLVYKQDGEVFVAIRPNIDIPSGQDFAMTAAEALVLANNLILLAEIAVECEQDASVKDIKQGVN